MEHKHHKGAMIDNRMVNDNHQEGIKRVIQRKSEYGHVGQPGKMISHEKSHWRREGGSLTPRRG
jgi:hypothetical protein